MKNKKTSLFSNGMIWFGAGVSIAEMLTGTLIAPLGFAKGFVAIILGHLIGCLLLFLAGVIGGKTEKSAMEAVKLSFGQKGAILFSVLNVVQLLGWTAVMIFSGSSAAAVASGIDNMLLWSAIIGLLILLWIIIDIKHLNKLNLFTMSTLFILTMILCKVIFSIDVYTPFEISITFGEAVELSVAMPISWLPLISDYTRHAEKPVAASVVSSITYTLVSIWMYVIGMGASICTGESDVAYIMAKAGLGTAAILIVIFSTVTTTFLDVYSAGVSCQSISGRLKEKPSAIVICILGTLIAIFSNATDLEGFLYFIGSVFAPMIAIQIADYFILKKDNSEKHFDVTNIILWGIGFIIYRLLMKFSIPFGYTFPSMAIICFLCVVLDKFKPTKK